MKRSGFTLIEMLIVIAIIGILVGIGGSVYFRLAAKQRVVEAQNTLAEEISTARSQTRRYAVKRQITWTASSVTVLDSANKVLKTVPIPNNVTLSTYTTPLVYTPPYGRTTSAAQEITLTGQMGFTAKVRMLGVTGKVIKGAF